MKKKRQKIKLPISRDKSRKAIKQERQKIHKTSDFPMVWVYCQTMTRKTKGSKFNFFQKRVALPVCAIRSGKFHALYEECYGCTKWQEFVSMKGGKYVKRRQKIEKEKRKKIEVPQAGQKVARKRIRRSNK